MAILVKEIKPSAMKVDAMALELVKGMREVGKEIQKDFEKTTKTWKHKPKFVQTFAIKPGVGPELLVGTDDEIYRYVDEGTKPHLIFAGIYTGKSNKKALAFPSKFGAKTKPGVIGSTAGMSGGPTVVRPYVSHPGTKARHFDKEIQKKWTKLYKRRMERAMAKAAKASGHAL